MAELIYTLLAVTAGALAVLSWRRAHRVAGALMSVGAMGAALVAIRDLPEPVVVALLLAALGVIALITAWPLVTGARPTRSRTETDR